MVLSTDGILCPFLMSYTKNGAPNLCRPPQSTIFTTDVTNVVKEIEPAHQEESSISIPPKAAEQPIAVSTPIPPQKESVDKKLIQLRREINLNVKLIWFYIKI